MTNGKSVSFGTPLMKRATLWIVLLPIFLVGAGSQPAQSLPEKVDAPSLVVLKSKRRLELYSNSKLVKSYPVGLGLNPVPAKKRQGDRATPEGEYYVCGKNPNSTYYMALIVSYPNRQDAERGLDERLINKSQYEKILKANDSKACPPFYTALGGEIEIHGRGSGADWTWGCIALDDPNIEELYKTIPIGTSVIIKP